MEFSSWSVVKGDGAFHGLFVWDRVRMSDQKVVVFPPSFKFSGCLITMYSGLFVGLFVQVFPRFFNFL